MVQLHDATSTGRQRIEAGLALLGQAARDAGQGLHLLASGLLILTAETLSAVVKPQAWRRAFKAVRAGAGRLLALIVRALAVGARAVAVAAPILALWLALSAVVAGLSLWSLPEIEWGELGQQLVASLPAIAMLVLLLGAFAISVFLLSKLIELALKRLTFEHAPAVLIGLLAVGAGAAIAAMISDVTVFALVAWFALVAFVAGAAGFAVISFGPALSALITFGGRSGGGRRTRKAKIIDLPYETVGAEDDARPPTSKTWPPRAWPRFMRPLAFVLALALLGALSSTWLRSPSGQSLVQSIVRAERAAPNAASPAPTSNPASTVLLPLADGGSGEVYWRHGYRSATMHMDDGAPVQDMALPPSACEAAAIVVFGAASADGATEMNVRLAQRRAFWAGSWAQRQLSRCSSAPPVFAVSLGQAAGEPASQQQRRLRVLALPPNSEALTPTRVQEIAESAFTDLSQFTLFDVCAIAPEGAAQSRLVDPCLAL